MKGETMERNYCVYKHTTPSGKVYVGLTGSDPKKRWDCGHGYKNNPHFVSAIKKYGWNNIKHEIIRNSLTQEEAGELERQLIIQYDSTNPENGYNVREGGTFGFSFNHTEEAKHKISESSLRRWSDELEHKIMSERMSGENNPFYGKTHSIEIRKIISDNNKRLSNEQKYVRNKRLSEYWKGKSRSKESVEKSAQAKWKPVSQYTKQGEFLRTWDSAKEACETLHIQKSTLCQCCKGIKPSAGGYVWRYV